MRGKQCGFDCLDIYCYIAIHEQRSPLARSKTSVSYTTTSTSRNVNKLVHILLVPPQILLLHQPHDPLLDHVHLGYEMVLDRLDRLRLQRLVTQLLFRLHDPYDRRVEIVLAVRVNVRLRPFRFLGLHPRQRTTSSDTTARTTYRVLGLDRVDVHLGPRIRKVGIKIKYVVVADLPPHRSLPEDFFVRTR